MFGMLIGLAILGAIGFAALSVLELLFDSIIESLEYHFRRRNR